MVKNQKVITEIQCCKNNIYCKKNIDFKYIKNICLNLELFNDFNKTDNNQELNTTIRKTKRKMF